MQGLILTKMYIKRLEGCTYRTSNYKSSPNYMGDIMPNCIALLVHSTFTVRSQNTIYSGYN